MDKRIRIGIIGLRNIGMGHAKIAVQCDKCEFTAAADLDEERLKSAASLSKNVKTYKDANDLICDKDVDAVVVALPNHLHARYSIAALKAGKDVLVEKPMAMTCDEARKMIAARDESGKILMVGMNQRFPHAHRALKEAIDKGLLGEIYAAKTAWLSCRVHGGLWNRGDWFLSKDTAGGGPIIDLGVHRLDLALYFMNFPKVISVNAVTWNCVGREITRKLGKDYSIEDGGIALIRLENGRSLLLEASYFWNGVKDGTITELAGTKGGAFIGKDITVQIWGDEKAEEINLDKNPSWPASSLEHFVRAIRGEEELIPTAEQGLRSLEIIEAIYKSAESGREAYL